jgi:Transposase DDE domain/Insertion element 4 transposase N-terminal
MSQGKTLGTSGARLADYLSASLLARVFPTDEVHAVLDQAGVNSQRVRAFPAVAGVYYCMGLSLYPEQAYESVFAAVAEGLAWSSGAAAPAPVAKSAISKLRTKLGCEPLQALVQRCCKPLADPLRHPQGFYAGRRIVAIDGSKFEVPDEAQNKVAFGYPGSRTGQSGYPQAQSAVLVECATHAILAANIGAYRVAEWEICQPLLKSLGPGMLCLADRGFNGFEHWQAARATGADLLWRCAKNRQLPVHKELSDGSYLSALAATQRSPAGVSKTIKNAAQGIAVRVIEYSLPGSEERYRLLTSLMDEREAPALELAALYHQRWQVEAVFDELKTHLRQQRRTLRSKTPDLVRQEFYGWVLAHYAVRWLMHEVASLAQLGHERLSFTAHVNLLKRAQPRSGAFPPRASQKTPALVA